ncbi:hypothetical protein H8356DRAFT_1082477 [Neocallimastix lanati (nom. inval.)]|uniref:Uncharacterized protein n=1 Tax=Neocallimastix californiae TaxID=1754190 RepID=A0A1Y2FKV4_9FUNG|nr:hypothetical protein H8356DRAFT_1082477 [Neocallimastix sp. JGI-2020a]ORY84603.1 hypothetical protein LY90DRAFT_499321 [Neocallimastix californiae]|eukprot:ORY84603.1 hypothetical protein LY90DRAFT_499321 [Neocallimastix californiae]
METLFQDRSIFKPGESEIKLNYAINKLKKLQYDIYFGNVGFNENVATMNLDQLISEYIAKSEIFYRVTQLKSNFEEENLFKGDIEKNDVKEILEKYQNNDIIKYQSLAIIEIQKGILSMENLLIEDIYKDLSINNTFFYSLMAASLSTLLLSIYYAYTIIHKLLNDSEELVNVIFILYLNTGNPIPDFKEK